MVVFRTCMRLGAPEEALAMAADSVKYGLFPMRNSTHELLMNFVAGHNIEGVSAAVV